MIRLHFERCHWSLSLWSTRTCEDPKKTQHKNQNEAKSLAEDTKPSSIKRLYYSSSPSRHPQSESRPISRGKDGRPLLTKGIEFIAAAGIPPPRAALSPERDLFSSGDFTAGVGGKNEVVFAPRDFLVAFSGSSAKFGGLGRPLRG